MSAPEIGRPHAEHDHGPERGCEPLEGPEYPEGWTVCIERAWQLLCEDVDLDQAFQEMRDEVTPESVPVSVSGACVSHRSVPHPYGVGVGHTGGTHTPGHTH